MKNYHKYKSNRRARKNQHRASHQPKPAAIYVVTAASDMPVDFPPAPQPVQSLPFVAPFAGSDPGGDVAAEQALNYDSIPLATATGAMGANNPDSETPNKRGIAMSTTSQDPCTTCPDCTCAAPTGTEQQPSTQQHLAKSCEEDYASTEQNQPSNKDLKPRGFVPKQFFLNALVCAQPIPGMDSGEVYRSIKWTFSDIRPQTGPEAMLASMIISTYQVMSHQLYLAAKEVFVEGANPRINMAARLQKMFIQQLNQLAAIRREIPPQQVMQIKKVDITGGQTVVGFIERKS